eukprot:COSAG02_NODE_403_length_23058_cov_12.124134_6_plen_797_part_00
MSTTFEIDDSKRLLRFLILGAETGTYSVAPHEHAAANIDALSRMLSGGRGEEAVALIKAVSVAGRAAKQTTTMTALAVCAQAGDTATRQAAYCALPAVCRIPTHLFEFIERAEAAAKAFNSGSTGWGRARRRAVSNWYASKKPDALAEAVTKYQQRNGWSHVDVLRLSHTKPSTVAHATILSYVVDGLAAAKLQHAKLKSPEMSEEDQRQCDRVVEYLAAVEATKSLKKPDDEALEYRQTAAEECAALILAHNLRREHVPSWLLNEPTVWDALLKDMPLTALTRNLGKISSLGMLSSGAQNNADSDVYDRETEIVARLGDAKALQKARVHPFLLLVAKATYDRGHGQRGDLSWTISPEVSEVLGTAFELALAGLPPLPAEPDWCMVAGDGYRAAQCAEAIPSPAKRRILQAVDVSGSMAWSPILGSEVISARLGAASLAYINKKRAGPADTVTTVGFGTHVTEITGLEEARSLDEATKAIAEMPDGPFDLVLMLDCTGSMGCWIAESKKKLISITEQISCWFPDGEGGLRVGFVAYRDINDRDQYVIVDPTSNFDELLEAINAQSASGGGDTPEDIAGAFHKVLQLPLREEATKLLVHICDAPCHGTRYHSADDTYPKGDPDGRDPEQLLAQMAARGIDYVLFDVDPGGMLLEKMKQLFKEAYDGAVGRTSLEMGVYALGHDASRLERTILESVERSACGGGTDCAAAMLWAMENDIKVDCFVVYTDNETTSGDVSAAEALRQYREKAGIAARLAVVALTAGGETVADPEDHGMIDFIGFDASAPAALEAFIAGHM